jgi:hypothetical protein
MVIFFLPAVVRVIDVRMIDALLYCQQLERLRNFEVISDKVNFEIYRASITNKYNDNNIRATGL